MNESAAATAARVFENKRLVESTNGAIAQACADVAHLFADDDARTRAAAAIADGVPDGVTIEAARRMVTHALASPELKPLLRKGEDPGSLAVIKARYAAARNARGQSATQGKAR